jgi:hypothetical protein
VLALRHLSRDGDDGGAMAKRRSTIPVAHADVPTIAFTNEQWQAIEHAYGRQLNAKVRRQITTVTTRYLKNRGFERTAAPKEMVREHIELIHRAAGDLERAMLGPEAFSASFNKLSIEPRQSAHSYAYRLIRRHLVPSSQWELDSALHVRPDLMTHIANVIDAQFGDRRYSFDAQFNRQRLARDKLHHFRSALKSLVVASSCALNEFSTAAEEHYGKAWDRWTQGLTRIAKKHGLPAGVSPEVGKNGWPLPFVSLVEELESFLPADARPRERSPAALAMALLRARNT